MLAGMLILAHVYQLEEDLHATGVRNVELY